MKKFSLRSHPNSASGTARSNSHKTLSTIFILLSISSTQLGAALAKGLFPTLGPVGTVAARVGWASLLLLLFWHKQLRQWHGLRAALQVALFGLVLAAMNLSFYAALSQAPLGVVVTLEFVGPLTLAVVQSRKLIDIIWVILAATGISLLAPLHGMGEMSISLTSVGLSLLAGIFWAGYILLSARVGKDYSGGTGLACATACAAIVLLPVGIAQAGSTFFSPPLLLAGAGVGLLSTALPYSLEMEALRYLPSRVFSILLSLEPMIAGIIGVLVLHEQMTWQMIGAMSLICVASVGVVLFQHEQIAHGSQVHKELEPEKK